MGVIQISGALSMLSMMGGWFFDGPAQLPFTPTIYYNKSMINDVDMVTAMDDNIAWVVLSQIFLGLGSAMFTIPSLPAMLFFIPEENEDGDENPHRSFVTGFWVTIYSASVAIGNTLGSELYEKMGVRQMSGFMLFWCVAVLIGYLTWIFCMMAVFRNREIKEGAETPKTVAMSGKPIKDGYEAPSLPAPCVDDSFDGTPEFDI